MASTRDRDRLSSLNRDHPYFKDGVCDDDPRSYGSQPPPRIRLPEDDLAIPRRGKSERHRPRSPDPVDQDYSYSASKPSRRHTHREGRARPPPQILQDAGPSSRRPIRPKVVSPPPFAPSPPILDPPLGRQEHHRRDKQHRDCDIEDTGPRRIERRNRRSSMPPPPPVGPEVPYEYYEPYPAAFDPREKGHRPKGYRRCAGLEPVPPRRSRRRSSPPPPPPMEPRARDRHRDRDGYEPRPPRGEREGRYRQSSPDGGAAAAYAAPPSLPRTRSHERPARPAYSDDGMSPPPRRSRGRPPPVKAGRQLREAEVPRPRRSSMPATAKIKPPWWQNKTVQAGARTAAIAGAQAAFRSKDDKGPWMGPKGAKVATAALSAALVDGFLAEKRPNGSERPMLREGGKAALREIDKRWAR